MKNSSRGSQSRSKSKRVKNRLMVGDSKLSYTTKPDNRDTVPKLTRSNVGPENFYADQVSSGKKKLQQVDGGKFKRSIKVKSQRAAQVYGSKKKAMDAYYKQSGETRPKKKTAPAKKQTGGLTRNLSAKPGTAANPIMGPSGRRSNRARRSFI